MGWQKRGSGRTYNSKSGVGTLIGNNTGKIVGYGVRLSDCRMCGKEKATHVEHKCAKNWDGSAKAMESDVGVELIHSVEEKGANVATIIMDDDTTTMAKIRREIDHPVEKWSDSNHTTKHLTNSLYSLQKKHKCLTTSVIGYFKKCFNFALAQTKGNAEAYKSRVEQIVPHAFGEHDSCGDWCGYKKNPTTYKHSTLTKDMEGGVLREDLEIVFKSFSQNASKIAPGGSTKEVESFNSMVATKAPKRCHFSASGNLLSRVGCAVAQKNMGNSYMNAVNEKLGLSPGRVYEEEAGRRDTERKRQREYKNKHETKLRRVKLKFQANAETRKKEKSEGVTYSTAVATTHHADYDDIPPAPAQLPQQRVSDVEKLVFCDLETGGLAKDADILQISGVHGDNKFDCYVKPTKQISPFASKVTGLTSLGQVLFLNGSPVPAYPLHDALQMFVDWLRDIGKCVLVGHNFRSFDFPRILRALQNVDLYDDFKLVCDGGIDTMPLFREAFPEEKKHSQEHLCKSLLGLQYGAHNALEDVESLQKLFNFASIPTEKTIEKSFSTHWVAEHMKRQDRSSELLQSYTEVISKKVISRQTASKFTNAGLAYGHVVRVFERQGIAGLFTLVNDKIDGAPRVKCSKGTIETLAKHLSAVKQ